MKRTSTSLKSHGKTPMRAGNLKVKSAVVARATNAVESIQEKKRSRKLANLGAAQLTAAQLKDLELRLRKLREEFRRSFDEKAETFNIAAFSESLIKGDDAEVAEKQRVNNAALQELDFLKTRLQLVQRAINKINAGVYGVCEETEEPIGFERLNIVPWAKYAVHVQEVRERRLREYRGNKIRAEL